MVNIYNGPNYVDKVSLVQNNLDNFTKIDKILNTENQEIEMGKLYIQTPTSSFKLSKTLGQELENLKKINKYVENFLQEFEKTKAEINSIVKNDNSNFQYQNKEVKISSDLRALKVRGGGDRKFGPAGKAASKLATKSSFEIGNKNYRNAPGYSYKLGWKRHELTGIDLGRGGPRSITTVNKLSDNLDMHKGINRQEVGVKGGRHINGSSLPKQVSPGSIGQTDSGKQIAIITNHQSSLPKQVSPGSISQTDSGKQIEIIANHPRGGWGSSDQVIKDRKFSARNPQATIDSGLTLSVQLGKFQSLGVNVENGNLMITLKNFFQGFSTLSRASNASLPSMPPSTEIIKTAKEITKTAIDVGSITTLTKLDKPLINKAAACIGHTASDSFPSNVTGIILEGCTRAITGDINYLLPCTSSMAGPGVVLSDISQSLTGQPSIANNYGTTAVGAFAYGTGLHQTANQIINDYELSLEIGEPASSPIMSRFFNISNEGN